MLDSDTYDVIILGTGLAESIAAAALAKAGQSVLHLDPNDYYGGEQASLTLDELVAWSDVRSGTGASVPSTSAPSTSNASTASTASTDPSSSPSGSAYLASQRTRYSSATTTGLGALAADRRRYALTLFPSLMVSRGDLVGTLISSDVSKYVGFRLLDGVSVWEDDGTFHRVPGAKEDVFKDKSISLLDKRRLMKALMFAGGEFEGDEVLKGHESDPIYDFLTTAFSLTPRLATALTYAVTHAASPTEPALAALERARKYLRSIGRYGPSAFLVGQYGGAGEVAQGFCRACAVFGGTYILGPDAAPTNIALAEHGVTLSIGGHPRPLRAKHLIASPDYLPPSLRPKPTRESRTAHAVVILTSRPSFLSRPADDEADDADADDTAVLILPPREQSAPLIRALLMGEGTGSCPAGQYVVYLWTDADAGVDLLEARVKDLAGVAFEAYYTRTASGFDPSEPADEGEGEGEPMATKRKPPLVVLNPYAGPHTLTEGLDWEAREGQRAFEAVRPRVL